MSGSECEPVAKDERGSGKPKWTTQPSREVVCVETALRKGWVLASRSLAFVFLDALWKGVWLAATAASFGVIGVWFASQLSGIEWEAPSMTGAAPLVMAGLLWNIWNAYAGRLFGMVGLAAAFSLCLWILLEAYVRARVVGNSQFRVFLLSGLATRFFMGSALLAMSLVVFSRYPGVPVGEWPELWVDTRGAFFIAVVVLLALGFLVKVFETAVRTDAVELFARNLFVLAGVVGTLMVFEAMIDLGVIVILVSAAGLVSSPAQTVAFFLLSTVSVVGLTFLNSYLLLVRFSAVDIMSGCECNPDAKRERNSAKHEARA